MKFTKRHTLIFINEMNKDLRFSLPDRQSSLKRLLSLKFLIFIEAHSPLGIIS